MNLDHIHLDAAGFYELVLVGANDLHDVCIEERLDSRLGVRARRVDGFGYDVEIGTCRACTTIAHRRQQRIIRPDVVTPIHADRGKYRSEEHTSELQSLMRISYAVFCLKKKTQKKHNQTTRN